MTVVFCFHRLYEITCYNIGLYFCMVEGAEVPPNHTYPTGARYLNTDPYTMRYDNILGTHMIC